MSEAIVNKVAGSGLVTIDLEKYLPKEEMAIFDLKDHLFMGLILKEKDFREALKNLDWSVYRDKYVAITCSTDAGQTKTVSVIVAPVHKVIISSAKLVIILGKVGRRT